jgi:hypothetical protein
MTDIYRTILYNLAHRNDDNSDIMYVGVIDTHAEIAKKLQNFCGKKTVLEKSYVGNVYSSTVATIEYNSENSEDIFINFSPVETGDECSKKNVLFNINIEKEMTPITQAFSEFKNTDMRDIIPPSRCQKPEIDNINAVFLGG